MPGRKECCGYGTSYEASHWRSLDPCGLFGVSFSWLVHFYALAVNGSLLISNSVIACSIYFAMYIPTSFLAMMSLYKAWTTDPGAVPMGARPLTIFRRASTQSLNGADNGSSSAAGGSNGNNGNTTIPATSTRRRGVRRCHKCDDNYKPPRAHHDSITGRCIVKFDHFCPWVGNSVGAMNHKFFCLFLLYTAATCLLSLVLLLLRVIHCGYFIDANTKEEVIEDATGRSAYRPLEDENGSRVYKYPECTHFYGNSFVMGLLVASLVFFIFTCTMGCEQLEAIETGKGKIARMKMKVGSGGTEYSRVTEEFNEMFGGTSPRFSFQWLWPTNVEFPKGMQKVVLGYEWDPTYDMDPYESDSNSDRELEEMENGKTVSKVPSSLNEGDGLVLSPPGDDISMSELSGDENRRPGIKNRKTCSARLDGGEADIALPPMS